MEAILSKLIDRFGSKKFAVIVGYAVIALFGDLDPSSLERLGYGLMTYLGAQGAVDFIKAR